MNSADYIVELEGLAKEDKLKNFVLRMNEKVEALNEYLNDQRKIAYRLEKDCRAYESLREMAKAKIEELTGKETT